MFQEYSCLMRQVSTAKSLPVGAESEVRERGGVPWDWADETVYDCWVVGGHVCHQMIPIVLSPGGDGVGAAAGLSETFRIAESFSTSTSVLLAHMS